MRTLLLAGVAIVSLAGVSAVHAADIYEPAPGYGAGSRPPTNRRRRTTARRRP